MHCICNNRCTFDVRWKLRRKFDVTVYYHFHFYGALTRLSLGLDGWTAKDNKFNQSTIRNRPKRLPLSVTRRDKIHEGFDREIFGVLARCKKKFHSVWRMKFRPKWIFIIKQWADGLYFLAMSFLQEFKRLLYKTGAG